MAQVEGVNGNRGTFEPNRMQSSGKVDKYLVGRSSFYDIIIKPSSTNCIGLIAKLP